MKAVVFAYHDMGIVGLEALKRHGFEIESIFSHHDRPNENIWFGSVVAWANDHHVACFCPETVNSPEWVGRIGELLPDVIFSFYYRTLLSAAILESAPAGAYNLHGSLLPAYRGRCPVNWVLVKGEKKTGVTLHHMAAKADAGDIVGQKEVVIDPHDTAYSLFQKMCSRAAELLDEILPLIKNRQAPRIPQDPQKASYFGGRNPEDGKIDWSWPVARVYNLIRAVTEPYPGAFSFGPEGKLIVWQARPDFGSADASGAPGSIRIDGNAVFVRAADGWLQLQEIEPAGIRLKEGAVLDYFAEKKGVILK
jgi:UDP-4-amino-4-deoxy-L-arabinose formyltransferase/UDP-glucuronic acid dehydrogenase (UDP-4-keto-hexauronic acid decarboxylating)